MIRDTVSLEEPIKDAKLANFASLIGSSRETVSRIMSRLKNDSIINMSARGLEILDKKQLEKRAFG